MDDKAYRDKVDGLQSDHEALCKHCGECCGANTDDPCSRLRASGDGRYFCSVYEDRLGPQYSRSGNLFTCVMMRDVHLAGVYYNGCGYNR